METACEFLEYIVQEKERKKKREREREISSFYFYLLIHLYRDIFIINIILDYLCIALQKYKKGIDIKKEFLNKKKINILH